MPCARHLQQSRGQKTQLSGYPSQSGALVSHRETTSPNQERPGRMYTVGTLRGTASSMSTAAAPTCRVPERNSTS